jgi:hypothetical protein
MRDQARAYADAVESQNTPDSQANVWLNQWLAQLWGMLTTLDPMRYKVTTALTTDGSLEYDFADAAAFAPTAEDFMSIVGVDWMSGGGRFPLEPYGFNERAVDSIYPFVHAPLAHNARYAVHGQGIDGEATRLVFDRRPQSGPYEVHYIQAPQTLDSDIATFDGVAGCEEWAILNVAILMRDREESDTTVLERRLARVEANIQTLGAARDSGRAHVPAKVFGRHSRLRGWPCG